MSRLEHFHEPAGDPIIGYNTGEGTACRDCSKNNVEFADVNPRNTTPILLSHVGEGRHSAYPSGFTCVGCGETIGDWDHR